jgi:putative ABC transport system permease protein
MFGREEFRPILDGITIGLQVLLVFIGSLTLGIGMACLVAGGVGTLPLLGPAFKDTSGKGDIHLSISLATVAISTGILVLVGVLSGLAPAWRASRVDPAAALRYQ